jgi:F-type H+-transporting ATPase subunit b
MIISVAHAASHAAAHAGGHSTLQDPTFWAGVSFVVVVVGLYSPLKKGIKTLFGVRAEKIKNKLSDARALREDTQKLLADYEKKLHNAEQEADAIVEEARSAALRFKNETKEQLENDLAQKEKQATGKIKMAQNMALEEIRNHVANISMEVTEIVVSDVLKGEKASRLIDEAINELPEKVKAS